MEINIAQILFQIINFGVVAGALTFLLYKPVLKTLKNRSEKIAESQKAAEQILTEREDLEKTKKQELEKAKRESAKIMSETSKEADTKKSDLMASARKEVKTFVEAEKEKWEKEKVQLMKNFQKELRDAVFVVTERVVGKGIDEKTHGKLIDDSIKQLSA